MPLNAQEPCAANAGWDLRVVRSDLDKLVGHVAQADQTGADDVQGTVKGKDRKKLVHDDTGLIYDDQEIAFGAVPDGLIPLPAPLIYVKHAIRAGTLGGLPSWIKVDVVGRVSTRASLGAAEGI